MYKYQPIPVDVLEKWEVPPINEVNRKLERIERAIKRQEDAIDEVRFVIKPAAVVYHRYLIDLFLNMQDCYIRKANRTVKNDP